MKIVYTYKLVVLDDGTFAHVIKQSFKHHLFTTPQHGKVYGALDFYINASN